MPDILMLKYKNSYQLTRRRSIIEHRNFGQRKTVVRPRRLSLVKTGSGTYCRLGMLFMPNITMFQYGGVSDLTTDTPPSNTKMLVNLRTAARPVAVGE